MPSPSRIYVGCSPLTALVVVAAFLVLAGHLSSSPYVAAFIPPVLSARTVSRSHMLAPPCFRVSAMRRRPVAGRAHRYSAVSVRMGSDGVFNEAEIVQNLERDYRADLALLATKFGTMIERVEDIEEVHVTELDGDHMSLAVIYCDHGEQTCVAVAVPIKFPFHCDDESSIIHAIHDLEEMEDVEIDDKIQLPKKNVSPQLMETIARITVVMNRDFQEELVSFVRAFGGPEGSRPTGKVQMTSLTPDGFIVQASMFPEEPVTVTFPQECVCASDFQRQILALSEEAVFIAAS